MKDLESTEHRAMEREVLRAARERSQSGRDYSNIGVAMVLFFLAGVLYVLGSAWVAGLFLLGAVFEIGGWATLLTGNRKMRSAKKSPHA
jgi:hypothetical protein